MTDERVTRERLRAADNALANILDYVRAKDDLYAGGAIRQFAEEARAALGTDPGDVPDEHPEADPAHMVGGTVRKGLADARRRIAYEAGWVNAARWAKREDLLADMDSPAYLRERDETLGTEADDIQPTRATRTPPPGIVEDELRRIVAQVAMPFSSASDNVLEQLRTLVHQCELAQRLTLAVIVRAAVAQLDAHAAADKPDVRGHDRDSYIAGYQDARTDADEAMRREFDK